MAERQRRNTLHHQPPPSRQMRSLLRQAILGTHRLLRSSQRATAVGAGGEKQIGELLELCRRAAARERHPDRFVPAARTMPATVPEAAAMLNRLLALLRQLDATWQQRLTAAGIDPKWPEGEA